MNPNYNHTGIEIEVVIGVATEWGYCSWQLPFLFLDCRINLIVSDHFFKLVRSIDITMMMIVFEEIPSLRFIAIALSESEKGRN